jgi:N-acetylneuraminic acid mutarotase
MPIALADVYGFQTEVVDGKIYAIGGYSGAFIGNPSRIDSLSSAEVYDPSTDKWTTLASMSATRCYHQTEVIDGKIYAIGGWDVKVGEARGRILSSTEVYDPSTNKWTTLSDMSTARYFFQTEVIDDKIYAIGGFGPFSTADRLSSIEVLIHPRINGRRWHQCQKRGHIFIQK